MAKVTVEGLYIRVKETYNIDETRLDKLEETAKRLWFKAHGFVGFKAAIKKLTIETPTSAGIPSIGTGLAGLGRKGTSQPSMFAGSASILRPPTLFRTTPPSDDSGNSPEAGD